MILTGPQIREYGIVEPHVERGVFLGVSYGESVAGYDIRLAEEVKFDKHSRFALGYSLEKFHMPNDIVGLVKDKSTWARQGLMVGNTVIKPGWRGYLTLELFSMQEVDYIMAGAPIAQVLFFRTGHTAGYDGKYQDQEAMAVNARFE